MAAFDPKRTSGKVVEQSDEARKKAYAAGVMGLYKLTALAIFTLTFTFIFVADDTTGWGSLG